MSRKLNIQYHHAGQTPLRPFSRNAGVTLVEMLVVVGMIGLMTSLIVPAFNSIGRSGALNSAGNQVADLIGLARQNSLAANGMTALVLVTLPGSGEQAMTVMQLLPRQDDQALKPGDWTQITGWIRLPTGVFADVNPADTSTGTTMQTAVNGAATTSGPPLPVVNLAGTRPASYRYALFTSSGALFSGSNAMILLANGSLQPNSIAGNFNPSVAGNSSYPPNYYRLTIVAATGRVKIDRP